MRRTASSRTSPWMVQPKAVASPASMRTPFAVESHRRRIFAELADHLVRGAAHIGEAVRLAHRNRDNDRIGARGERCAGSSQVGHQGGDGDCRQLLCSRHDLGSIRHLRHQLCRHERSRLETPNPAGVLGAEPGKLVLRRHHAIEHLQPVAQPDLDDLDLLAGRRTHGDGDRFSDQVQGEDFALPCRCRQYGKLGGCLTHRGHGDSVHCLSLA